MQSFVAINAALNSTNNISNIYLELIFRLPVFILFLSTTVNVWGSVS